MLEFMLALENLLKRWPDGVKMTVLQIAEQTKTSTPHVMEYLCDALNKTLDLHDPMSYNEVSKAFAVICDKSQDDLRRRQQDERMRMDRAIAAYETTMEKINIMQAGKNWRSAYRTLDYFFGKNKDYLPTDTIVDICNNCLRLGIKAEINFQELTRWLRQGISTLLAADGSASTTENALDFIDAYGDFFIDRAGARGESCISSLLMEMKPAIMEFNLNDKLNEIAHQLGITSVMDITI